MHVQFNPVTLLLLGEQLMCALHLVITQIFTKVADALTC
jgi:hypothetical protein